MSFRTVVITKRCKLDYKMNFLEVRKEDTKRILLDDIHTLIIENPAVSLTGCLVEALIPVSYTHLDGMKLFLNLTM